MKTNHNIYIHTSQHMMQIDDNTIDLVVTSPPYPMIEMWDEILGEQNPNILECLENEPEKAFEMMHQELDKVWKECFRVIKPGGFLCINIGDATRTINGKFTLYNNHSHITKACIDFGFFGLPNIIWRVLSFGKREMCGFRMCGISRERSRIYKNRKQEKEVLLFHLRFHID